MVIGKQSSKHYRHSESRHIFPANLYLTQAPSDDEDDDGDQTDDDDDDDDDDDIVCQFVIVRVASIARI